MVEFDHFMIGGIRRIQEADLRQAATIATTSQPSALYRLTLWPHETDLMAHTFLPNFLVAGFGWDERGRDEGWARKCGENEAEEHWLVLLMRMVFNQCSARHKRVRGIGRRISIWKSSRRLLPDLSDL